MMLVFVSGGGGKEDAQSQGGCGGNGKTPTIIYYDATYKTNADRIRKMSDEELAEWISGDILNLTGGSLEMATEAWLDWLKQEVAE